MIPTNPAAAAALCLATALTALSGCTRGTEAARADSPPAPKIEGNSIAFATNAPQLSFLTLETVAEQKTVASSLSGRLAWDDDVTARVFAPVSGRIVAITAEPGQRVAAGGTLARIHSPDFGQAQADARKAIADEIVSARALARARDLFTHRAAALKDVETAEADHARAQSEKERALATLALYGADGGAAAQVDGLFALKAPVAGLIVEKATNPGQEVRGDQIGDKPLFVISDPTRLWLFLDATEADIAALAPGQEVLVRARVLPGKLFHGRIATIGEGLDPTTRTVKVRCTVDNAERSLRAEMYVNADVAAQTGAGVEVPTKALFAKDTQHYVFVATAPGRFQRRAVQVGTETNGRSRVSAGLAAGEQIVVDGCLLLEAILEGEAS